MLRPHALRTLHHMKLTGFTLELPQLPTNYILEERSESPHLDLTMEELKDMELNHPISDKLVANVSDIA